MSENNDGYVRLIKSVRNESKKVSSLMSKNNMLGTVTSGGLYLDSIEDEIPRGEFLRLETVTPLERGDRVLCIPVGGYFVIVGKVV